MVPLPLCLVQAGAVFSVLRSPQSFRGPDGTRCPSTAFALWSDADWAAALPDVTRLPLMDANPATELQVGTLNPVDEWTIEADRVVATYTVTDLTPAQIAVLPSVLAYAKAASEQRIRREADSLPPVNRLLFLYDQGLLK